MTTYPNISGVILAGGKSSRFGENKAFARLHGVPLIFQVLKAVNKYLFPEVMLVTNSPEEYRSLPVKVIQDDIPHQGPLGGIATALRCARHDRIFVVACDMPLLNISDIHAVIEQSTNAAAGIPICDGIPAYLMAVYARSLLVPIKCYLAAGERSMQGFCQTLADVAWLPLEGRSAANINTKQDLQALEVRHAL
jgi:molybdopterin-guanine dinucleotide biosynthesis protein A